MKINLQGSIYLALCILLWSFIPVFAKFAGTSLDHHQYLFYSSIVSFASLLVVLIFSKSIKSVFSYKFSTYVFLFFLGFLDFFYYLLLYFGYQRSNGLEVLVVQYTWPIFIVLLSVILLKESLGRNKILSLVFGFSATILVLLKGDIWSVNFTQMNVILFVALGAFSFALFSVLSKKVEVSAINAVCIYFFSAVLYSFFSVFCFSEFKLPNLKEWGFILINGVFLNGISYLFWIKALQGLEASFAAMFIFVIPILSAFLLVLVFGEEILGVYLISLVLVIVSGVLASLKKKSKT